MANESLTLMVATANGPVISAPRFRVVVTSGPDAGEGAVAHEGRLTIGTADGVSLRLTDPTVSRFHAELEATEHGIAVRDLGSTNGTSIGPATIREVLVRTGADIDVGRTKIRLFLDDERAHLPASNATSLAGMIGTSALMRAPNCALGISTASTPTLSSFSLMSGWRMACWTAACSAAMAALAVAAGATRPYHPLTS